LTQQRKAFFLKKEAKNFWLFGCGLSGIEREAGIVRRGDCIAALRE
jgi:hypothetical protein